MSASASAPEADREADPAEAVSAAVLAVDGVVSLHAGAFGEVATLLPGRRVTGVRLADPSAGRGTANEVHVVASAETPVTTTAAAVHAAVAPLVTGPVHVVVEDVVTAQELREQREREERERVEAERAEQEKRERAEAKERERAEAKERERAEAQERERAEADAEVRTSRADATPDRTGPEDVAGDDGTSGAAEADAPVVVVVVAGTAEVHAAPTDGEQHDQHDQKTSRDDS